MNESMSISEFVIALIAIIVSLWLCFAAYMIFNQPDFGEDGTYTKATLQEVIDISEETNTLVYAYSHRGNNYVFDVDTNHAYDAYLQEVQVLIPSNNKGAYMNVNQFNTNYRRSSSWLEIQPHFLDRE